MANDVLKLPPPDGSKEFLSLLKMVLEKFKLCQDVKDRELYLSSLVTVYLDSPPKIPAKRVVASFFQNLDENCKMLVTQEICDQLTRRLMNPSTLATNQLIVTRHCVDNIAALMENFKLGEFCLSSVAVNVFKFLVRAEEHFLSFIDDHVPPVMLNELMHHCHATVQTLNLHLQKIVVGHTDLTKQLISDSALLMLLMDLNLKILKNELFLLDCRGCCAINIVVLMQLALCEQALAHQIPYVIFPNGHGNRSTPIPWLSQTHQDSLNTERMSTLAYLSMTFGYLAAVLPESVTHDDHEDGWCFFLDSLLPHLLSQRSRGSDTMSKVLLGKTVHVWTTKLWTTVQDTNCPERFLARLNDQSSVFSSLLEYVWTHCDDQLDAVRQSSKSIFENILKVHFYVNSAASRGGDTLDTFMESVLSHVFLVSWTSRGKFSALTASVPFVGAQLLLKRRPELPVEILQQLQEQALSCYASELFTALLTSHRQQLTTSGTRPEDRHQVLCHTWIEPVVRGLCCPNQRLKKNMIEYLLPKLMKSEDMVLGYMMETLTSVDSDNKQPLYGAMITCLRRAQALGLLRPARKKVKRDAPVADEGHTESLWSRHLSAEVLKTALCCSDEQIRLDAFALLCDSCQTTEAITASEFQLLKLFIPSNVNNQSPSFRQSLLSHLNKLLIRLKESLGAAKRQSLRDKNSQGLESCIQQSKDFLTWLTGHVLNNLYPGSAFARRTTSLAILSLVATHFVTEQDSFQLCDLLEKHHILALLECLADTFEENKKEALKICTTYIVHKAPIWDREGLVTLISICLRLACSTRPQDCSTAAYNFLLMLQQLQHWPQIDLRDLLPSATYQLDDWKLLPQHADTSPLLLLNVLLTLLDDQISVANQSLITAAANRPMYPTLHCIHYILQELNFKKMSPVLIPNAQSFIERLIKSCLTVSRVVSPVVQNSSPEGNIPEAVMGPGLNISGVIEPVLIPNGTDQENSLMTSPSSSNLVTLSQALVESMPEYLVVCCWRSIKEVSLTLGHICLQIPASQITEDSQETTLLSYLQVQTIGDYFISQLLESIHRGAFELAYSGFQLMCQMLWGHTSRSFNQLPQQWIWEVVEDIQSEHPHSKLCSTRRSAGVPFFIQAVTSTEPATAGRKCFHYVMKELVTLAVSNSDKDVNGSQSSNAQVHALNVLRSMFRDARLGEEVLPYVADGLKAAILGFKSEQWAVRNSATLLLSALLTRIFGVKRSKDEANMSKKNCQTGRAFFYHYPSLYPFLLSELEQATEDVGSKHRIRIHPSLYPVLLVLGRLFPSTLEGADTSLNLSAFIPYVMRCAASPVYKTRVMAARAIQPLARLNQVVTISKQLLEILPVAAGSSDRCSSSYVHGILLQLVQLSNLMKGQGSSTQAEYLEAVLPALARRMWIVTSSNNCFATRQTALVYLDTVLDLGGLAISIVQDIPGFIHTLRSSLLTILTQGPTTPALVWKPHFFDFERTKAWLIMKHIASLESLTSLLIQGQANSGELTRGYLEADGDSMESSTCRSVAFKFVQQLLDSELYEVRLETLDVLLSVWKTGNSVSGDCSGQLSADDRFDEGELGSLYTAADGDGNEQGDLRTASRKVFDKLAPMLFPKLLTMAVETETHHECLQKTFDVLASLPNCTNLLSLKSHDCCLKIFVQLLEKMRNERRIEVKAAMLHFTGFLAALVYSRISWANECLQELEVLREWTTFVKFSSATDDDPELTLCCCHVLLMNVETILRDPGNKLGDCVFLAWDSLAILLQEDDLEVKEIAANVVCAILQLKPGSFHASYALHCLPAVLVSTHADKNLPAVVTCLLSWMLAKDEDGVCGQESIERLFDKGEMNVYRDQVVFIRSIKQTLSRLFGLDQRENRNCETCYSAHLTDSFSDLADSSAHLTDSLADLTDAWHSILSAAMARINQSPEENWHRCVQDEPFVGELTEAVSCLAQELSRLSDCCQVTDVYTNSSRFLSVCQGVYQAKVLLHLFHRQGILQNLPTCCQPSFLFLEKMCLNLMEKFKPGNILTVQ